MSQLPQHSQSLWQHSDKTYDLESLPDLVALVDLVSSFCVSERGFGDEPRLNRDESNHVLYRHNHDSSATNE